MRIAALPGQQICIRAGVQGWEFRGENDHPDQDHDQTGQHTYDDLMHNCNSFNNAGSERLEEERGVRIGTDETSVMDVYRVRTRFSPIFSNGC